MRLTLVISILIQVCWGEGARYDNHSEYKIHPDTPEQAKFLNTMIETWTDLVFQHHFSDANQENFVIVAPEKTPIFESALRSESVKFEVVIQNFQDLLDEEKRLNMKRSKAFDWTRYSTLEEFYAWYESLATKYSKQVQVITIGQTFQKRDMKGLKISFKEGNPAVYIEGGIHAREWISPATVSYIVNELLSSTVPSVRKVAEQYDWYIVPILNVDGYKFTHNGDRLWRKNMRPEGECIGSDLNRNFDAHWMTIGASPDPCHETYAGPSVTSELETQAITNYLMRLKGQIKIHLTFHSFSQLLLYPYAYAKESVANSEEHHKVAAAAVASLAKRYGTKYRFGRIFETIYPVSGSNCDWGYDTLKANFSYTYELRPGRGGMSAFILPPDQIIPTAEETLDSLVTLIEEATKLMKN